MSFSSDLVSSCWPAAQLQGCSEGWTRGMGGVSPQPLQWAPPILCRRQGVWGGGRHPRAWLGQALVEDSGPQGREGLKDTPILVWGDGQWNLRVGASRVACNRVRAENPTRANKEAPDEPQTVSREHRSWC